MWLRHCFGHRWGNRDMLLTFVWLLLLRKPAAIFIHNIYSVIEFAIIFRGSSSYISYILSYMLSIISCCKKYISCFTHRTWHSVLKKLQINNSWLLFYIFFNNIMPQTHLRTYRHKNVAPLLHRLQFICGLSVCCPVIVLTEIETEKWLKATFKLQNADLATL